MNFYNQVESKLASDKLIIFEADFDPNGCLLLTFVAKYVRFSAYVFISVSL